MAQSDSNEPSGSSSEETGKPQESAAPVSQPKSQLARRVADRLAELEAALGQLEQDPANHKRCYAIAAAIKAARTSMNLNGDRMSPMESSLMSRWLESSKYLT